MTDPTFAANKAVGAQQQALADRQIEIHADEDNGSQFTKQRETAHLRAMEVRKTSGDSATQKH